MLVASDEATSGSVIAKQDLIVPSSKGANHSSFCSWVPKSYKTSIFPVSGAEQLNTSGAHHTFPVISASGAYSTFVKPAPYLSSGRKRFHRPLFFAFSFRSSRIFGICSLQKNQQVVFVNLMIFLSN